MSPFVCHKCRQIVPSIYDQFERRIEFRRLSDQGRHRVLLTGRLCRDCVDAEVDGHRPPPDFEQQSLI